MSIRTELDRIIDEVLTQSDLLDQALTALQGKVAGADPVLQEKTVTPSTSAQSVTPDSGYDGLSKVTVEAMPTATQATPFISVDEDGLISASWATLSAGYVSAGTQKATKQLTTQAAQTITPGTANKTINGGQFLTGMQTIKGDANLVAENIKSGVSIFGVAGSYEGSGESGGGVCTVEIIADGPVNSADIYYMDENADCIKRTVTASGFMTGITLTVQKNSFVYATMSIFTDTGNMSTGDVHTAGLASLMVVNGDGTFVIN